MKLSDKLPPKANNFILVILAFIISIIILYVYSL